jgi:hypothetical protein
MTRATTTLSLAMLTLLALAALAGCGDNPVGRICFLGGDPPGDNQNIVSSPALECQSRTCVHIAQQTPDLCTGECSSDSDCDKVSESPCDSGFACMIPVTVGGFCCKKLCVCKDYLEIPPGGLLPPDACDANNAANECCNLPGRRGNAAYPQCS